MLAVSNSGADMLLSVFTAIAVGLAFVVVILTVVIPFVLGYFDHRDTL